MKNILEIRQSFMIN